MKKLLIFFFGSLECRWENYQKPATITFPENEKRLKFNEYQPYLNVPESEGIKFVVTDHPDQQHGIKDGRFTYVSESEGDKTVIYFFSSELLDREEQEEYQFKLDLYDVEDNLVNGPVWYSQFILKDRNDNTPTIDPISLLHAMEEDLSVGSELPERNFMNNPSNGVIKILDNDKSDSISMDFAVEVSKIVFLYRSGEEYEPPEKNYFEFKDILSDKFKKKIIYANEITNILEFNRAKITVRVSDCASDCNADGSLISDDIEITVSIQDVNTYPPVLNPPNEEVLINENTAKDVPIFEVTASDNDVEPANIITKFSIVSCRIDNKVSTCPYFKIQQEGLTCGNANDCNNLDIDNALLASINKANVVTTEIPVDYEAIQLKDGPRRYIIVTIIGSNIAAINPINSKPLVVKVYVDDENEKPILQPASHLRVKENQSAKTEVGIIVASDPEGSKVEFILAEEDQPYFEIVSIDGNNGMLKTNQPLDREGDYTTKEPNDRNTYRIRVRANEVDENPNLTSNELTYEIVIEDENDNGPQIGIKKQNEGEIYELYSCKILTPDEKMADLPIFDPDQDFGVIHNRGGLDGRYYKFDPITGTVPYELSIRQDPASYAYGLYSDNIYAEWIPNVKYQIRISGKDSNIDETATMTELNLNICDCNATETETAYCDGSDFGAVVSPKKGGMPWWATLLILLVAMGMIVIALFVARGQGTHEALIENSFGDEDDVKATLIEYNTEGAQPMEKTDWFRKPKDEMFGEEVVVMPQMMHVNAAKSILPMNLNSTNYLNDAKENADADPSAPPHDSLRTFNYEGENSDCDLDSVCSSSSDDIERRWDQLDKEFRNIGNMFSGVEADDDLMKFS